jgi:hypothetical protein
VIIGFSDGGKRPVKLLYDYEKATVDEPQEQEVTQISPYLTDAPPGVIPTARKRPLLPVPESRFGNMPNDGGCLILDEDEREAIREDDPIAEPYVRRLLGAKDMLNGSARWCLWLVDASPNDIAQSAELRRRTSGVREHRLRSSRKATKELAATPARFAEIRQPSGSYVCIPRHTSANRSYIPAVLAEREVIAHDSTLTIETEDPYLFGLLHSSMWMAWVGAIGGRIKGDYRVSSELTYNTFPWPETPSSPARDRVAAAAETVLEARERHPDAALDVLYDPVAMPADLAKAHRELDRHVDRLYGRGSFDAVKRLSMLLRRYEELSSLTPSRISKRN